MVVEQLQKSDILIGGIILLIGFVLRMQLRSLMNPVILHTILESFS